MAEKPDPELDELLASAAADFAKAKPESTPAPANFDPSMMLNADGSFNPEKWKAWQEEQKKAIDAESKKADEEFANSDLGKELGLKLQEGFAAAAAGSGLSTDELNERLKSLNLLVESAIAPGAAAAAGVDADKDFSDAIMGAMQSLKENLSEAFPAAYPAWLEENKSKLSEEDFKRYTEQLEVIKEIVAELEKEGSEDDKQHLDNMVKLMGKAQDLGQPPPELAAQLGNTIDDSKIDAMLKDSGADQCNIM